MTIHLIAAGKLENPHNWPEIWKKCYKSWKGCPYKVKIWGNEDIDQLLKEDDKEFFNTLNSLPSIYKWDYVRYVILEKFGGGYFDMDVEIVDPSFFKKLQNKKLYIVGSFGSVGVENSIMIAKDRFREDFWHMIKTFTKNQIYNKTKLNTIENVAHKTGPIALSNFLVNIFKSLPPYDNSIQILPWEMFGQGNQDLSHCIHHYSNSWYSAG